MKKCSILLLLFLSNLAQGQFISNIKSSKRTIVNDSLAYRSDMKRMDISDSINFFLKDLSFDGSKNEIDSSMAVPPDFFDMMIYKSINQYTLFNALKAAEPNIILDVLDQSIAINYNHTIGSNRQNYIGVGLKANYSTDSKDAPIYSDGSFIKNVSFSGRFTHFLRAGASFTNANNLKEIQKALNSRLKTLDDEIKNKFDKIGEVKKAIDNYEKIKDQSENNPCCLYCLESFVYDKNIDSLKKQLDDYISKRLEEIMSFEKIGFKSETLKWWDASISVGTPSYKIYDATNAIGKRLTDKQIADISITTSFNQLTHYKSDRVLFYSLGFAFNKTANTDDISSKSYTEQTILDANSLGNVYAENTQKAYQAFQLKGVKRFKFNGELVFIFLPQIKSGIDNFFELATPWFLNRDIKAFYTNRFGFVFPVSIVKDKVKTMIQVYWKASGQIDTQFKHEFGFKIGLPININK